MYDLGIVAAVRVGVDMIMPRGVIMGVAMRVGVSMTCA